MPDNTDHFDSTLQGRLPRVAVLLALMFAVMLPQGTAAQDALKERPRGVIFFIADGTGPATYTVARDYLRGQNGPGTTLSMDLDQKGSVMTHAVDSRITDSASSATAYATGVKTYNGAIGMNPDRRPIGTVLEAAETNGWNTALISTARITHATPAAFSAHVPLRAQEEDVARQQLGKGIEILLGGGRSFFFGPEEGGRRGDSTNVVEGSGYHLVSTRDDLLAATRFPVLGLFSNEHMAYEVDRRHTQEPSIAEMTSWALERLEAAGEPFFIMIEAGRIDHAGHNRDIVAHLADMLAYDDAYRAAAAFASSRDDILLLATSDHETGGLTLGGEWEGGGSGYRYDPAPILGAQSSIERFSRQYREWIASPETVRMNVTGTLEADFGFTLGESDTFWMDRFLATRNLDGLGAWLEDLLRDRTAQRAAVHWSTSGHTAVDVPLYARGPGADAFTGSLDNQDVGRILSALMDADLEAETKKLRR
ncbi:MAG: alkaline phosphatase [Bacteroidetes bacterium CG12_big_fil_rev_8_21_14_0_65_60_17]|nr:MAG: alkaline phosphatase [Bacteroidetes bacterium CG12_big_fil_rev_8_21_14_0_65_60_17]